jgi:hypothetical protein
MAARDIIEQIAHDTGVEWNEDSMIDILCDYIDNQDSMEAFEDYVQTRAEEELEDT